MDEKIDKIKRLSKQLGYIECIELLLSEFEKADLEKKTWLVDLIDKINRKKEVV